MKPDAFPGTADEYAAAGLIRFKKSHHIWCSEGAGGAPDGWYATRRSGHSGGSPTVAADSAQQLAETLADQLARSERRKQLQEQYTRNPGGA